MVATQSPDSSSVFLRRTWRHRHWAWKRRQKSPCYFFLLFFSLLFFHFIVFTLTTAVERQKIWGNLSPDNDTLSPALKKGVSLSGEEDAEKTASDNGFDCVSHSGLGQRNFGIVVLPTAQHGLRRRTWNCCDR